MAEIYRARLEDEDVALKWLLPQFNTDAEFLVMLADEARITGLLDHPNVVRLFEFGAVDDQHFLAMEFVDGVDLRALLRRCRERGEALPAAAAAWIIEQSLRGLQAAHTLRAADGASLNLVHRDFSPSNLLVSFEGDVKLIDFGIAKDRLTRARTRGGMIKGKLRYMSPEQTEGRRLDARSDVFSAGVVLYQAAVGQAPFNADDDAALMWAIRHETPPPPSHGRPALGEGFDALMGRALAKAPEARYPSAAAFAEALRAWRLATAPAYHAGLLGEWLQARFAAERQDTIKAMDEADLAGELDDSVGSVNTQYTRLVEPGWRTASGVHDPAADLEDQIESWRSARRSVGAAPADGPAGAAGAETSPGVPPVDP